MSMRREISHGFQDFCWNVNIEKTVVMVVVCVGGWRGEGWGEGEERERMGYTSCEWVTRENEFWEVHVLRIGAQ